MTDHAVQRPVRCHTHLKSEPPPLRIGTTCPKRWDDMSGDAKQRFCDHCQLHVHNLSAMSTGEREQFIAASLLLLWPAGARASCRGHLHKIPCKTSVNRVLKIQ